MNARTKKTFTWLFGVFVTMGALYYSFKELTTKRSYYADGTLESEHGIELIGVFGSGWEGRYSLYYPMGN